MFEASTLKWRRLRVSSDRKKRMRLKWTEIMMRQRYAGSLQAVTATEAWACSLTDDDDAESHRQAAFSSATLSRWSSSVFRGRCQSSSLSEKSPDVSVKSLAAATTSKALCTFIWREINTSVRSYLCSSFTPDPEPHRHFEVGVRVLPPPEWSLQASSCHGSCAFMWAD